MAVRGRIDDSGAGAPAGFAEAHAALRRARVRPEILLGEAPAPQRLAPFSLALTAEVIVDGQELATGRLVVLHDPDGQEAWHGVTRLVAYAKADCEPEMVADPLLPSVGWAWLTEALEAHGAAAVALSGATAELELRASWTPLGDDLNLHVEAWADLLCTAAGLPPVPHGVATLHPRRRRSSS